MHTFAVLLRTYMYILLVDRIKQKFIHTLIRKNECYVYDGASFHRRSLYASNNFSWFVDVHKHKI